MSTLEVLFARTEPATNAAKPACMKKTRYAEANTKVMLIASVAVHCVLARSLVSGVLHNEELQTSILASSNIPQLQSNIQKI
mmetsp:Transcript_5853/g.11558  ORF Transcript_5853/g.11558 Transcript_5853/m.11558 type:complete len:82 (-) Transcript_5853:191-436(-)